MEKLESWMAVGPDYEAAHRGVALVDRRERHFLRVTGRAPGEMLKGILTGRIPGDARPLPDASTPAPPSPGAGSILPNGEGGAGRGTRNLRSEARYSALLTPKGKMVSDLRVLRDRDGSLVIDLPEAGLPGAAEHLKKFLPPRLARADPTTPELALLTLLGPKGADLAAELLEGGAPHPGVLHREGEGAALLSHLGSGEEVVLVATDESRALGLDLLVPASLRDRLTAGLISRGAVPVRPATWSVLQLERGRPVFGVDMDQDTIPVEAGIHHRAVDHAKGCYTGQEVIVRIRDRGQVNKRLAGLLFGNAPIPEKGTELFRVERDKPVGWVTRAVFSPAFGEGAGLAYLRREVAPGEEVRMGGGGGPPARVVALNDQGWALG